MTVSGMDSGASFRVSMGLAWPSREGDPNQIHLTIS
jgi:hypothetical protein